MGTPPPTDAPPGAPEPTPAGATPGDFAKALYTQRLDVWFETWKQQVSNGVVTAALEASRTDAKTARAAANSSADRAAATALVKSIHDAYIAVAQGSMDRALTRVNVVTAAIGAVSTVYTGLLALVYAAKADSGRAITGVALIPALFLGSALLLVTIYAAMFRNSTSRTGPLLPSGTGDNVATYRLTTFMNWCFTAIGRRIWALHAGIVSLGWAVVSLPLPFLKLKGSEQVAILLFGVVFVALAAFISYSRNKPVPTQSRAGAGGNPVPNPPALARGKRG